jgi:ABC-type cobalamin transport system permease subunit
MKPFLKLTAIIEGLIGLALAFVPSAVTAALLGNPLTDPAALLLARLAGVALISLAIACWLSRNHTHTVMMKAMLTYNCSAIILLVYADYFVKISGPGLWPAVLLHLGLGVWGVVGLSGRV